MLDKAEQEKANQQFKKLDHSERQACNLSNYINFQKEIQMKRDEYIMEYNNGEYIKTIKPFLCGI